MNEWVKWDEEVVKHEALKCKKGQPRLPGYGELDHLYRTGMPSSADWIEWAATEIIELNKQVRHYKESFLRGFDKATAPLVESNAVKRLERQVESLLARPCIHCGCDHAPEEQRD